MLIYVQCTGICVPVHRKVRGQPQLFFFSEATPLCFEMESLTGLKLTKQSWLAGYRAPGFPSLHLLSTGLQENSTTCNFFLWIQGPELRSSCLYPRCID